METLRSNRLATNKYNQTLGLRDRASRQIAYEFTHTIDPYLLLILQHKLYQCRRTADKLLMMGRKTARNM